MNGHHYKELNRYAPLCLYLRWENWSSGPPAGRRNGRGHAAFASPKLPATSKPVPATCEAGMHTRAPASSVDVV